MAHDYVGYCVLQVSHQFFISRETSKETGQWDIIHVKPLLVEYDMVEKTDILCLE